MSKMNSLSVVLDYSKINVSNSGREGMKLNEPAKLAAEFSPGCSEHSERNPGFTTPYLMEPA